MLSDFLHALRRSLDQLRYFRHTHSPLSPWRGTLNKLLRETEREATRYGVASTVDRRRAYQVARMVVSNRHGEHLADQVPDAYITYSPPSAATFHNGKRSYASPEQRRQDFLEHPQTLAYLLTPPKLSRLGLGGSVAGGLVVIEPGESVDVSLKTVMARLQKLGAGKAPTADLASYAGVLLKLHAGLPVETPSEDTEEQAA
ncbi:MAG TPA: hypothetical protein QGG47_12050 [Acidobacteriota bacterium]|nr:hypothetical protein [Acidobacteriota bacterium]